MTHSTSFPPDLRHFPPCVDGGFADDFGVYFIDNTKGYVSSNRDGGKGSDDIYKFTYTPRNTTLDGTVLLSKNSKDFAKNISVILEDDKCNPVNSAKTNDNGFFHFENLTPGCLSTYFNRYCV